MDKDKPQPIIIIKKKGGHGGHHGGAWKVAYADFVTAMMALFIVLWLLSSDEKVQKAVGGYFQDPTGNGNQIGSNMSGAGEALALRKSDMEDLKERIEQLMREMPNFKEMEQNVQITITNEGLRVEMLETDKGMFFESGRGEPTSSGKELLGLLGAQLSKMQNKVLLEGHTDAKPYSNSGAYTNWELSTDRANSARRVMQASGLRPDQVAQVRGFADQKLRNKETPEDPANRRITVLVQYMNGEAKAPEGAKAEGGEGAKAEAAPAAAGKPAEGQAAQPAAAKTGH